MKTTKKKTIILIIVCIVLLFVAGTIYYIEKNGITFSTGTCIATDDGHYLVVLGDSPTSMHQRFDSVNMFSDLKTGDKILVAHGYIGLTYPSQTTVYLCVKLEDGDSSNVSAEIIDSLNELGWNISTDSQADSVEQEEVSDDLYVETIPWEDLDGNGQPEYLIIENDTTYGSLTVYFNEEPIYTYKEELRIVGVDAKEYIDLDNDDEKEIFVSFMPAVNSAPLEEWFALKEGENGWEPMEMHHNNDDMTDNAFPISATLGEGEYELLISCEGMDKEITFDATDYYEWKKREKDEFGGTSYDAFMNGNFRKGDVVGQPSDWGIWNIEVTRWGGQDCLVAEHGLQGPESYDLYGTVYIYFKFNSKAEIKLLHIDFERTVIPSLGVKSGEIFSFNRSDGHIELECDNERLYGFIMDDNTELIYEDTSIFDFYEENYPPTFKFDERSVFSSNFSVTIESGEVMEVPEVNRHTRIYAWYHADKIIVTDTHTECIGLDAKPVIYLYPESTTDVEVQLDYNGNLTCTYPKYQDGWNITAQPDGTLTDSSGQTYNYLYWEGVDNVAYDFSKGFCVAGKDTAAFLDDALDKLGLTRREANEFIVYWLPQMEANPYNLISFQTDAYTDNAQLTILPTPDTMLRVFMAWKPLEEAIEVVPQELRSTEREGFTVVEWGGSKVE